MAGKQTWTSKWGTKLDVTGLTPEQLKKVKELADGGYGTKAGNMIKDWQKKAAATPTTPTTTPQTYTPPNLSQTPVGQELAPGMGEKVQTAVGADFKTQEEAAKRNVNLQNPNFTNAFGAQTTTQEPDGTISVKNTLSEPNQNLLTAGQQNAQTGANQAGNLLTNYQGFNFDPSKAQEQGFQAAYSRLTENLDNQHKQDQTNLEQELHDKGIPYSADPNSQYQQQKNDLERRYNDAKTNAASQATLTGASLANTQFGQAQSTHQQNIADIGSLQNQGIGFQNPNFQQYQGSTINVTNPSDIAYKQITGNAAATNAAANKVSSQAQLLKAKPTGGGEPSAFSNSTGPQY